MIEVDIAAESDLWRGLGDVEGLCRRAVEAALSVSGRSPGPPMAVSLLLADDAAVRRLNRDFRGKEAATNVLSFPSAGPAAAGEPQVLGDLAFAYETLAREAEAEGKPLADHAAHLIVHGVLHLLGYDHDDEAEAEAMEALEIEALARLGIADPYRDAA